MADYPFAPHRQRCSVERDCCLAENGRPSNTVGASTAELAFDADDVVDLEVYLDVTRGEMLFAKGVVLVEGEAEVFIVPALAKARGVDLDELGITVCSVAGNKLRAVREAAGLKRSPDLPSL